MSDDVTSQDAEVLDPEIVGVFLDESEEALEDVDSHLVALETDPGDLERVNSVFRSFHSIKGNAAFFGFMKVKLLAHHLEDVLSLMRDGKLDVTQRVMDGLLAGVDELKTILCRVREQQAECPEESKQKLDALIGTLSSLCQPQDDSAAEVWPALLQQVEKLRAAVQDNEALSEAVSQLWNNLLSVAPEKHTAEGQKAQAESVAPAALDSPTEGSAAAKTPTQDTSAEPQKQSSDSAHRTMRVEERKIDEFLDYVGELIIVREMFANVGKTLRAETTLTQVSAEYQRALEAFTSLSRDLQHSIMEVRKIPVRAILQKVPRAVRDLGSIIGKEAQVELVGADIAVDKSLVEGFEAPIMHMVRNALDHGVEAPDEREKLGKARSGSISVTVSEGADEVVFTIIDDGAGIDDKALRDKAVRSGILSKAAAKRLSRSQAFDLLFSPGLSTAKKVTEISGRGVGMDVVKRNVQELGGTISVESEQGLGSTFRVFLPKTVTVQILDGFLVQVGRERFVLPLQNINESFRPANDEVHTVAQRGECITRRGRVFPLVRFGQLLKLPTGHDSPSEAIVVSIGLKDGAVAGLMVDEVLGTQQVVLRDVDGIDTSRVPFSGGAVLGDGRVAMVLDVEQLGELVA